MIHKQFCWAFFRYLCRTASGLTWLDDAAELDTTLCATAAAEHGSFPRALSYAASGFDTKQTLYNKEVAEKRKNQPSESPFSNPIVFITYVGPFSMMYVIFH